MGKVTVQLETAVTTISQEYLLEFTSKYGISEALHPELPGPEDRVVDFPEGKARSRVDVFQQEAREEYPAMLYQALRFPKKLEQPLLLGGREGVPDYCGLVLIRASNPTRMKTGSRLRVAHEVPLLTVTTNRVIEMEDPATVTDSSGVPSTIERSPLDFSHENPSQQSTGPKDQEATVPEVPPSENVATTGVAPEAGQAERVAAPRKSLAAIELGMGTTRPVPASQGAPVDVSDPDPLSFASPQSRPSADVTQSSKGVAAAGDPDSKNTSFTSMVGDEDDDEDPTASTSTRSRALTAFTSIRSKAPTAYTFTRSKALIASTSNAQTASTAPRGYRKIAMTRCVIGLFAPNAPPPSATRKRKST
nr:hypothetical protein [Tanacetum cinerariifolium]